METKTAISRHNQERFRFSQTERALSFKFEKKLMEEIIGPFLDDAKVKSIELSEEYDLDGSQSYMHTAFFNMTKHGLKMIKKPLENGKFKITYRKQNRLAY